jgi:KDO2-lipid IV(A) lauroyltransferase
MVVIYREANNPGAEWLIRRTRAPYTRSMHGKGREGAVQSIKTLKSGQSLAMLIDQKQNDGSPLPFFGRTAMTTTAPAQLAIRYQVPILAARAVRTDGAHFHVSLEPPLQYGPSADPVEAMAGLNRLFEKWIREHPSQWFWVHKRWG